MEGQKSGTQAKALIEAVRPVPSGTVPVLFAMLLPDRQARAVPRSVVAHVCSPTSAAGDIEAWAADAWSQQSACPAATDRTGMSLEEAWLALEQLRGRCDIAPESARRTASGDGEGTRCDEENARSVLAAVLPRMGTPAELRCFLRLALDTLRLRVGFNLLLLAVHPQGAEVWRRVLAGRRRGDMTDFDAALSQVLELRARDPTACTPKSPAPPTPRTVGYRSPDLQHNELLATLGADGVDWSADPTANPARAHRLDHGPCRGCGPGAREANDRGVRALAAALDRPPPDVRAPAAALAVAQGHFLEALGQAPGCSAAGLNAATLLVCGGECDEAYAIVREQLRLHNADVGGDDGGGHAEMAAPPGPGACGHRLGLLLLHAGLAAELLERREEARAYYRRALSEGDGALACRYFGANAADLPPGALFFEDTRLGPATAAAIRRTLLRLLVYAEFAARAVTYPASVGQAQAHQFRLQKHAAIAAFLAPPVVRELNGYYRELIDGAHVPFKDRRCDRYYAYHDVVGRFVLGLCQPLLRRLIGADVKPSYTYFIEYVPGSELTPHTDRELCEFVVSIQLRLDPPGHQWPIWLCTQPRVPYRGDQVMPPLEQRHRVDLDEGGAVVFKGREKVHWRSPLPAGWRSAHLLLHYVYMDCTGLVDEGVLQGSRYGAKSGVPPAVTSTDDAS